MALFLLLYCYFLFSFGLFIAWFLFNRNLLLNNITDMGHYVQIKLADKQAALEKTQWEAMTSNSKVEKLQEDLDSMQGEISSLMLVFEGLTNNEYSIYAEDYDFSPYQMDHLPQIVSPLIPLDICFSPSCLLHVNTISTFTIGLVAC